MFKFLIDNYDYTLEVTDLIEVEQQVGYNAANFVYTETLPSSFTGIGSLYAMLFARMQAGQFCESLDLEILKLDNADSNYYRLFKGKIMMSDLTWSMDNNEVSISVVNSDWQSRIENNYEVPVPMNARYSKSSNTVLQLPISLAQSTTLTQFIARNKADSLDYSKSNVVAWNIDNVFRHIVKYISDSNVLYGSAYLNTNYLQGDCRLWVTSGYNIRVGTNRNIEVTFKQMFDAARKALNLVIYFVKGEGDTRILKIEDANSVNNVGVGMTFDDIQNVSMSYDQNSYISSVKVGNTKAFQNNTEISAGFHFPKVEGANFALENFAVNRDCVINNVLDLTISDFIYDHNKIEDIIVNDNDEYDEDLFLIACQGNTPYRSDDLGISATVNSDRGFFNQALLNNRIIERHDVYGKLIKHHGIGQDTFVAYAGYGDVYSSFPSTNNTASITTNYNENLLNPFGNDFTVISFGQAFSGTGYDNNGNYNNTKPYAYVCPSTGVYTFTSFDKVSINPIVSNYYHTYVFFTIRNSGGTITQQKVYKCYIYRPSIGGSDVSNTFNYGTENLNSTLEPYVNLDSLATSMNGDIFITSANYDPQVGYSSISFDVNTNTTLYLDAGDYIDRNIVFVESDYLKRNASNGGGEDFFNGEGGSIFWKGINFACIWSLNGGNIEINTKDGSGKLRRLNFDTFLTDPQVRLLMSNSQMKIGVNFDGYNYIGKIMKGLVNHKDNICKFTLKLD